MKALSGIILRSCFHSSALFAAVLSSNKSSPNCPAVYSSSYKLYPSNVSEGFAEGLRLAHVILLASSVLVVAVVVANGARCAAATRYMVHVQLGKRDLAVAPGMIASFHFCFCGWRGCCRGGSSRRGMRGAVGGGYNGGDGGSSKQAGRAALLPI